MNETSKGHVEVVCGPMFSGKTEELQRRLRRATIARKDVYIFKPSVDVRYSKDSVVSHDKREFSCIRVQNADFIEIHLDGTPNIKGMVIGIDEAQFFDKALPSVIERIVDRGARVVVAGLDLDSYGEPFGPMAEIICRADYVLKLQAICVQCGAPASRTFRTSVSDQQIEVGGTESYEARCRNCWREA